MDLAKSAMLVSVTIENGGLLGERRDKTATQLVEDTYLIANRRAKASKFLIDRKHKSVKAVVAASQRVREVVYKYTLPWGNEKVRLLPVDAYGNFKAKISQAEKELREAWQDYQVAYPSLIAASETELGHLFNRQEYPAVDQIAGLFTYKLNYWPIPESGHFVAKIAEEAAKEAREAIESEIETRLIDTTYDLADRIRETTTKFVDKLSTIKQDENGETVGVFRDSLVDNCFELANLVAKLNITNNPVIADVAKDLKRIGTVSKETLRSAQWKRDEVIPVGNQILTKLASLARVDKDVRTMVTDASEYF